MTTYDVAGFTAAMNLYLQNPGQYSAPNWANYVLASPTTPTTPAPPSSGSATLPAPHVDAPKTGSDQQVPPSLQNTIINTSKNKITEVIESKASQNVGKGQFGGLPGQYGNAVEVIPPAKIVTNVEPIVSIIEPLVGGGSIDEKGQFGTTIIGQAVLPKEQPKPTIATIAPIIPKIPPPTTSETPVENKMQKVPLTPQQLKDIQTYTDNVTKSLTEAKASGAKTIQALVNGKVVDSFPVNDHTKEVLFAAIPSLQKNYGSITLGFTGATTTKTTTQKIPLTQDQISQVHTYTENIVQTVQEAKASGAKNILVLDQSGKQIDSIPVGQDTTRILFAAVPNLQKEGKQITLSYTPQMKTVLSKDYTPSYAEDLKTYGSNQVNLFTEVVKGTNEITKGFIDTGKSVSTYILSGGKVWQTPEIKSDILSNTLTSPIKTTIDSSGKTTTTVSVENAKEALNKVLSDIQQNPARQFGRLIPGIATMIGTGLASEGIGSLVKGGSSALTKVVTVPKDQEPFTGSFVRQYPTYRATNMMRTKLPSDIFSSDNAQPSSFISKNIDLGSGAIKTGGGFSDTEVSLGRGSGGSPPTSTPKDFINAIKDLPTRPSKNAPLPSYEFKPTDTEGGNVSTSGKQSLVQKTETKPQETVAKTIQKQLEENQKKVENLYGQKTKTTTKTTTKTDQVMKEYNDVLAGRKAKMKQIIADQESYFYTPSTKVITIPKQEQTFKVENIFEPLQKQTQDIITVPKQGQKQVIDVIEIPTQKTTTIFDVPTKQIQINDVPQKQIKEQIFDIPSGGVLITTPITTTKQTTIPDIPTPEYTPLDIPVPTETTIPDIFGGGGGKPFNPLGGMTGGFENPHGSKKRLFVDYDVSEDPLGISNLGQAEYNPFGNKTQKITQVKIKTPTSKTAKMPKYDFNGMFKMPKSRKKNKESLFDF